MKTKETILHTFEQLATEMIRDATQHKKDTGEDYVLDQKAFGEYLQGVVNGLKE